ncbi:MAG: membrane protease subunit HflK [Paracoccaceae bacterium]|jgi:membrane protease subunit HflK
MAGNNGGPWGGGSGGGSGGGDDDRNNGNGGGRRPGGNGDGPQIPEIEEIMKKGQEQLRVLMGGRGGGSRPPGGGGGDGFKMTKGLWALGGVAAFVAWFMASFYTVAPEEQGVELLFGKYYRTTENGPHLAIWPIVNATVIPVTTERSEGIGVGRTEDGLMLTTDENIVDLDFQVVWNINNAADWLFNLRDGQQTVRAVSESAMREIIARSELAPILNRDRGQIEIDAQELIQATLNSYESGISIVRINLDRADPPAEVIDAFRDVQAAEQERDRLQREADAYANRVLAGARGEAAQVLQKSEAYRAQVVNEAQGEASRFSAVLTEYQKAPEVTRKRLYLETMEKVLGRVDKVILDQSGSGGQGVVPYLPLNDLRRGPTTGGN